MSRKSILKEAIGLDELKLRYKSEIYFDGNGILSCS